jgi:hypothetical protein
MRDLFLRSLGCEKSSPLQGTCVDRSFVNAPSGAPYKFKNVCRVNVRSFACLYIVLLIHPPTRGVPPLKAPVANMRLGWVGSPLGGGLSTAIPATSTWKSGTGIGCSLQRVSLSDGRALKSLPRG